MAVQTIQVENHQTGLSFTNLAVAADAGLTEKWAGSGAEMLMINNGGGSAITLTENYGPGGTVDGQALPNRTFSVPAGATVVRGPYPPSLFNDSTGNMNIGWSAVTSVKLMVFKMGN